MEVTGIIEFIGQPIQKTPTFVTREIWLTTQEQFPQTYSIQFTGDKTNLLNNFQVGQSVSIGINLRGNKFQDQQTGEWKCFNSIHGWKINLIQQQGYGANGYQGQGSAVNAYHQQQQSYNQPQQGFQPQQGYGQPQNFQQPQQGFQQPQQGFQQPQQGYAQPMNPQSYSNPPQGNFPPPTGVQDNPNQPYP